MLVVIEYAITTHGMSLEKVITELHDWGISTGSKSSEDPGRHVPAGLCNGYRRAPLESGWGERAPELGGVEEAVLLTALFSFFT